MRLLSRVGLDSLVAMKDDLEERSETRGCEPGEGQIYREGRGLLRILTSNSTDSGNGNIHFEGEACKCVAMKLYVTFSNPVAQNLFRSDDFRNVYSLVAQEDTIDQEEWLLRSVFLLEKC